MEYRNIQAENQSTLKKILSHPKFYLDAKYKQEYGEESDEDHFVFGSVVDLRLEGNKEEFERKFVVIDDEGKGSPAIRNIIKKLHEFILQHTDIDTIAASELEQWGEYIIQIAKQEKYGGNYKEETILKNVCEASNYFNILKSSSGKRIISSEDNEKSKACVVALKTNEFTKKYTDRRNNPNVEFLDKFIVDYEYRGVRIKGELDRVIIDNGLKEITPSDFKTMGKYIQEFTNDFWKLRYDFQAATYMQGIYRDERILKLVKEGYKINNFLYIVVEKNLVNPPMCFRVSDEVYKIGLEGGTNSKGYKYEGLVQAVDRLKFHKEENKWEYPMEYYQNKGLLNIEI